MNYPSPNQPFGGQPPPNYPYAPSPMRSRWYRWTSKNPDAVAYRKQWGKTPRGALIGCSALIVIVLLLCAFCGILGNIGSHNNQAVTATQAPAQQTLANHTLKPTATPTPVQEQPTPTEAPTQPPVSTGVNGNPWGYDFNPGSPIYSPASGFCAYFSCITSFWSGTGYVVKCADGMYSKSGGHTGSCSRHGGDTAILYQH